MKTYSIYSFWKDLIAKKDVLKTLSSLADFPFDQTALSYNRIGKGFPDLVIKTNSDRSVFTGGEIIKIKTRSNYSIAPFKSVIPSGTVNIKTLLGSSILTNIQEAQSTQDEHSLEERDVYFLTRGQNGNRQKLCLVHGSFLETIDKKELIHQSLIQIAQKRLLNVHDPEKVAEYVEAYASSQAVTAHVASVENASVNFKLKITAEVTPEGNILNSRMYPEVRDDTINLVLPYGTDEEKESAISKMDLVFEQQDIEQIRVFSIKHPFNGWFVVFQTNL